MGARDTRMKYSTRLCVNVGSPIYLKEKKKKRKKKKEREIRFGTREEGKQ